MTLPEEFVKYTKETKLGLVLVIDGRGELWHT